MAKTVAEILVELRKEKGLTQDEAADRIGIARSTLSGYELGLRNPKYGTLKKFAEFYDVPLSYLADIDEDLTRLKAFSEETLTPGQQLLLQTLKGATEDEILQTVRIIEALRK